jgi:hypothetical protein
VCSRNLQNEEAKPRYGAVKNTTTMGCNARKTTTTFVEMYSHLNTRYAKK